MNVDGWQITQRKGLVGCTFIHNDGEETLTEHISGAQVSGSDLLKDMDIPSTLEKKLLQPRLQVLVFLTISLIHGLVLLSLFTGG